MIQYGTASVYGVDGTVQYDGATAIATLIESAEGEHRANIEEFLDGESEPIGFRKFDEREMVDLVLIPKKFAAAGSLNDAKSALAYPAIPSKITLAGMVDTTSPTLGLNGDYIYQGGARRTLVRGQAALKLTCWKPKAGIGRTVAQLLTVAT